MSQTDLATVRKYFREMLPNSLEKVLNDEHFLRCSSEDAMVVVCERVCAVAAQMLQYRARQQPTQPEQLLDVDQDLVQLVRCLTLVFDHRTAVHEWYGNSPLNQEAALVDNSYAAPIQRTWGTSGMTYEDELESDELQDSDELGVLRAHLFNLFGAEGGFDAVEQVRQPDS